VFHIDGLRHGHDLGRRQQLRQQRLHHALRLRQRRQRHHVRHRGAGKLSLRRCPAADPIELLLFDIEEEFFYFSLLRYVILISIIFFHM